MSKSRKPKRAAPRAANKAKRVGKSARRPARSRPRASAKHLPGSQINFDCRALAEASAVGFWHITADGITTYINRAMRDMLEVDKAEDVIGQGVREFFTPESLEIMKVEHAKRHKGVASSYEVELITRKGNRRNVLLSGAPVLAEDGTLHGMIGTFLDITERKQFERELRGSERQYRDLVETSHDLIWSVDAEGRWTFVNQAVRIIYGYEPEEMLGRPCWDFMRPDQARRDREAFERVKGGSQYFGYETEHLRKDGSPVLLSFNARVVRNAAGTVLGTTGTARDISEHKRVQEQLEQQRSFLRQILDINPSLIFAKDREGRFTLVNATVARIYGTTVEQLIGRTDADFNPNRDEVEFFRKIDLDVMDSLQPRFIPEELVTDATGRVHWLQTDKVPIIGPDGRADQVLGVATDITERKRTELELRESRRVLATLMSNLPGLAYRCRNDPAWTMEFVSEGCLELTGYPPAALTNNAQISYGDLVHPDDRQRVWDEVQQALAERRAFRLVYRIRTAHGGEKWVWEQGRGVHTPDGEILALEGFVTDITERKRAEEALQRAHDELEHRVTERTAALTEANRQLQRQIAERERAEAELKRAAQAAEIANQAKTEFLSRMSHEIRTPLAVILACAEMHTRQPMSPVDQAEAVETIARNGRHLLQLLSDVLDVSRISTGKMEVKRGVCELDEVLHEVLSVARYKAQQKSIRVEVGMDADVPRRVITDSTKLCQVLINLMDNAVKFTDEGFVRLQVHRTGDGGRHAPALLFVIQDSGIGIDPPRAASLFDAFTQADSSITRRYGGTGLGLTIAKAMAELLGGVLRADGRPGHGSTFTLELPLEPVAAMGEHAAAPAWHSAQERADGLHGVRVLLGDDCADIRRILTAMLGAAGAVVSTAATAHEIMCAATRELFDIVLLDIHMPDMDGLTLFRRVRDAGVTLPFIAITADATAESRERCLMAGFERYVTKPFQISDLVASIRDVLGMGKQMDAQADDAPKRQGGTPAARTSGQTPAETGPIVSDLAAKSPRLAEAAAEFARALPSAIDDMQRAADSGDTASLKSIAHRLKGSGGISGYMCITDAAAALEQALREDDDAAVRRCLLELRALSQRMLAAL